MKLAIIGYGKMGKEIEKIAISRGHNIVVIINKDNFSDLQSDDFKYVDAAIEFTQPESAVKNYYKCFEYKIPVVSGTTGWLDQWDKVCTYCKQQSAAFFYASNFSIGVNILFHMNERLAQIMNNFDNYDVELEEIHHNQKLDAPSGTAITLADDIIQNLDKKDKWKLGESNLQKEINIIAHRIDKIPGEHTIKYESNVDILELKHAAKSRQGFAHGAVLAAEFIHNKKGIFSMKDLLKF
jgi:4-hydroxy-tetrahydrodipicolinate reductase